MTVNRQWRLTKRPEGMIGEANFEFVETTVPKVVDQQILIKNLYFSFDPTQRGWAVDRPSYLPPVGIGEVMRAGTVGQVVLSNHDDFSEGDLVQTMGGWQDYAVITPGQGVTGVTKVPDGVTPEMMLSVIGLTGMTLLWLARIRSAKSWRNGVGLRRCRCHRLSCKPDSQD